MDASASLTTIKSNRNATSCLYRANGYKNKEPSSAMTHSQCCTTQNQMNTPVSKHPCTRCWIAPQINGHALTTMLKYRANVLRSQAMATLTSWPRRSSVKNNMRWWRISVLGVDRISIIMWRRRNLSVCKAHIECKEFVLNHFSTHIIRNN